MSDITSRPYKPTMACELCCFGRGQHADFCDWRRMVEGSAMSNYFFNPDLWWDTYWAQLRFENTYMLRPEDRE